jgi:hypothetical protein
MTSKKRVDFLSSDAFLRASNSSGFSAPNGATRESPESARVPRDKAFDATKDGKDVASGIVLACAGDCDTSKRRARP